MGDIKEIWKKIPGSDNYSVSNLGNIKKGMASFVDMQQDMEGYFRCSVGGTRGRDRIHRFVAEAFVKNDDPEHKKYVDHIDGNKYNNNANNLRWVTSQENTQAAANKGLFKSTSNAVPCIGIKIDEKDNVRLFRSQIEASNYIGARCDGSEVNKALSGKRYTTHGWLFRKLSSESIDNIKQLINEF